MIGKPFVIFTSFAPTALLWPPLVCQDYDGYCGACLTDWPSSITDSDFTRGVRD